MGAISLREVSKRFANGHVAVQAVSLDIDNGELLVLVGPSGSGKSTVLRLIAGLEAPTSGRILIGGTDVTEVPPQQRDLAMVFQSYALYPHKTVRENLAFGLRVRGATPAVIDDRVTRTARSLGIEMLLARMPAQLSGGQRQRVALGRAIVREPQAFLLDEPLSNLDPLLRGGTRAELSLLHRRLGATMVYVTHDQEEAMTLGSRIAVMNAGRIEQVGPPLEVFERPETSFVARFVGSPAMNLWRARVSAQDGRVCLTTSAFRIEVDPAAVEACGSVVTPVLVGIRPHDIGLAERGRADADATVEVVEPLGSQTTVHVSLGTEPGELTRVVVPSSHTVRPGDRVGVALDRHHIHVFDEGTGRRVHLSRVRH